MTQAPRDDERAEGSGPTIRDKRRIDPTTYRVREPQATAAPGPGVGADPAAPGSTPDDQGSTPDDQGSTPDDHATPDDQGPNEVDQLTTALAERTADLQRLQAEYVNYKRRVDRDRDVSRTSGVESVLRELLPVLDTVTSARDHGELAGAFKSVADELEKVTGRHGMVRYGEAGDGFDPNVHEALMHIPAPPGSELTGPTCVQILQPGYRLGERVVRPARVAVAEPDEAAAAATDVPADPVPSGDAEA